MSLMGGEQKQHTEALVVHITLSSSKTKHSSRVCFHRETCLWHGACYTLQITFQTEHGFCKNAPSQEICWVKNNFVSIRYYFTYNFSHAHHRQDCFLSQEVSRNSPFNSTREKNPNPLNMEFSLLHYIFFFFSSKTYRSVWLRQLGKIDTIFQKYLYSASRCASSPLHTFTIIKLTAELNICLDRTDESRFFSSVNEALKPTENVSW